MKISKKRVAELAKRGAKVTRPAVARPVVAPPNPVERDSGDQLDTIVKALKANMGAVASTTEIVDKMVAASSKTNDVLQSLDQRVRFVEGSGDRPVSRLKINRDSRGLIETVDVIRRMDS